MIVVAVAVVAIVVVALVASSSGGGGRNGQGQNAAAATETTRMEDASMTKRARDTAAKALIQSAMAVMQAAYASFGDCTAITQTFLEEFEPSINWQRKAPSGVYANPSPAAKAASNAVEWATPSAMSFEIGTWSASGREFGIQFDMIGGTVFYADGAAGSW